jgi:hypothetical protein
LSVGQRILVGQFRGGVPIAVIEHHLEGILAAVAEMPDRRAVGIGHAIPLGIDQRLGQTGAVFERELWPKAVTATGHGQRNGVVPGAGEEVWLERLPDPLDGAASFGEADYALRRA